mgnify:CR=1 FL=1
MNPQGICGAVLDGIGGGISAAGKGRNIWTGERNDFPLTKKRLRILVPEQRIGEYRSDINSLPSERILNFDGNAIELNQYYMDGTHKTIDYWPTVSGPHGNGQLPRGEWRAYNIIRLNPSSQPNFKSYSRDGFDFWMRLEPQFSTDRTGIGIHPDGEQYGNWWKNNGTMGCPGIQSDNAGLQRFYNLMRTYLSRNPFIRFIF